MCNLLVSVALIFAAVVIAGRFCLDELTGSIDSDGSLA
jgi:hypothetical protein